MSNIFDINIPIIRYSKLFNSLKNTFNDDQLKDIKLPEHFSSQLINQLNSINFNTNNINKIIELIDFLDIDIIIARKFIISNLKKTIEPYKIDKINQENYNFPSFILNGFDINLKKEIKKDEFQKFIKIYEPIHVMEIIKEDSTEWLEYIYNIYKDKIWIENYIEELEGYYLPKEFKNLREWYRYQVESGDFDLPIGGDKRSFDEEYLFFTTEYAIECEIEFECNGAVDTLKNIDSNNIYGINLLKLTGSKNILFNHKHRMTRYDAIIYNYYLHIILLLIDYIWQDPSELPTFLNFERVITTMFEGILQNGSDQLSYDKKLPIFMDPSFNKLFSLEELKIVIEKINSDNYEEYEYLRDSILERSIRLPSLYDISFGYD